MIHLKNRKLNLIYLSMLESRFFIFVLVVLLFLPLVNTQSKPTAINNSKSYLADTPPGKDMPPAASSRGYRLRDFSESDLVKRPQFDIDDLENPKKKPDSKNNGKKIIKFAIKFLGVPYKWGGIDPTGFDCSGFAMFVYNKFGYSLPHSANSQYRLPNLKSVKKLEPGDLVFYKINKRSIGHVGIYTGDNKFIHAPRRGRSVEFANMKYNYWKSRYAGAKRVKPKSAQTSLARLFLIYNRTNGSQQKRQPWFLRNN